MVHHREEPLPPPLCYCRVPCTLRTPRDAQARRLLHHVQSNRSCVQYGMVWWALPFPLTNPLHPAVFFSRLFSPRVGGDAFPMLSIPTPIPALPSDRTPMKSVVFTSSLALLCPRLPVFTFSLFLFFSIIPTLPMLTLLIPRLFSPSSRATRALPLLRRPLSQAYSTGSTANQLRDLLHQNQQWASKISPVLLASLEKGQYPKCLWIGCSDSRVSPTTLTRQPLGSIFEHRNIANLVSPTDPSAMAIIEFAISLLRVPDLIVCGKREGTMSWRMGTR